MDGSLAERRQRDISPGNVESPRASERAGKTGSIRAERGGDGRMKGDEVEGWRGEMEGGGTRSRWRRGARVLERRTGGAEGLTASEILSRRGYKNFIFQAITPRTTATVLETPFTPLN